MRILYPVSKALGDNLYLFLQLDCLSGITRYLKVLFFLVLVVLEP